MEIYNYKKLGDGSIDVKGTLYVSLEILILTDDGKRVFRMKLRDAQSKELYFFERRESEMRLDEIERDILEVLLDLRAYLEENFGYILLAKNIAEFAIRASLISPYEVSLPSPGRC